MSLANNVIVQNRSSKLVFFVNGEKIEDESANPEWTLLYYLRTKLRLCGTKLGCGEGGCGACTVMVSKFDRGTKNILHFPINACLAPICSMHGLAVTTIEGIGSTKTRLHAVQERIAKAHGSQCGFCTPGIVMSMYTLLRTTSSKQLQELTPESMQETFQGNLCRCTGYRPIIQGYNTFLQNGKEPCQMGSQCCRLNQTNNSQKEELFDTDKFEMNYDSTQEPIFPAELQLSPKFDEEFLEISNGTVTWYRPTKLLDLLKLKEQFPHAKIVVGNTEIGVEVKFKNQLYPILIHPVRIPELNQISVSERGICVGASTTLTTLDNYLESYICKSRKNGEDYKIRIYTQFREMLKWFAGKQIRSMGCIGGNLMTGSPISDLIPILMASKSILQIASSNCTLRQLVLTSDFFTGYRQSIMRPDEVLISIIIPFTQKNQYFYAYKQARRREDDIAIVNCAFNLKISQETKIVDEANLSFGGMSFKTVSARRTERVLSGRIWNEETLELAYQNLLEDLPLGPDAPGGMISYRKSLVLSFFFRFYLTIKQSLQIGVSTRDLSGIRGLESPEQKYSQYFSVGDEENERYDVVQTPVVHASAFKQASGEALYCDDIPKFENELYLAFLFSSKSHARILSIDTTEALALNGVIDFICGKDVPFGCNSVGSVVQDEEVFYNDIVTSQGQIIGAIVALDQQIAKKAIRLIRVSYEMLQPIIISIEDAIEHKSFFGNPHRTITKGNIDELLESNDPNKHMVKGQCRIGGQEHFYLETQCVVVMPKGEDGEMEIFSSTQNPAEMTMEVAKVLQVDQNKIVTRVKRIGGGFGGKETRASLIALPVAIAARKLRKPIRCMLDRDEDMMMSGGRHPFLAKYTIVADENGKILGCDLKLYNNCGYSLDLSAAVIDRAMTHFENAYNIPVVRISGYTCKTNLPSNTAFRGFGGPQGMFVAERMIHHIAEHLGKDVVAISQLNLYRTNDRTFYDQQLENCTIQRCWNQVLDTSNFYLRRQQIEEFNEKNRYKKRGLSAVPTMYGIAFTVPHLNQGGALVLIYTDGSVLLSHGGVEMGQGLHTKMLQVASKCLQIPIEWIHISETATDKVPNTSSTAASSGSDLNGMAVMQACEILMKRLEPYRIKNPEKGWKMWIKQAYLDRISLAATGFYKTPNIGRNWVTNEGNLYNYYTYGAATCEVEIDTITGDHQVLRVDIVMDLGASLNPAIDVGQIEGAFMQGYGLFVLEEMLYSPDGTTLTRGPGTYKIPGFGDIPGELNVAILKGSSNPRAVFSSKAVGEPPLFLGSSVLFAIEDAIKSARREMRFVENTYFQLDAPATVDKIRMACQDTITSKITEAVPGTFKPWSVQA